MVCGLEKPQSLQTFVWQTGVCWRCTDQCAQTRLPPRMQSCLARFGVCSCCRHAWPQVTIGSCCNVQQTALGHSVLWVVLTELNEQASGVRALHLYIRRTCCLMLLLHVLVLLLHLLVVGLLLLLLLQLQLRPFLLLHVEVEKRLGCKVQDT